MRYSNIWSILALIAILFPSCSPETPTDEMKEISPIRVLPKDNEIGSMVRDGSYSLYRGRELYDHIDGAAEVFYTYGFELVVVQRYKKKDGSCPLTLEIYDMGRPENAKAIFDVRKGLQYRPLSGIGDECIIYEFLSDSYSIEFRKDKYYVVITVYEKTDSANQVLQLFALSVAGRI